LREDLYYRIATITIEVPPLRERADDIGLLADHMLKRYSDKFGRQVSGFSPAAYAALRGYGWPGNVRELENAIERAVLLTHGPTVGVEVMPLAAQGHVPYIHAVEALREVSAPDTLLAIASDDTSPVTAVEDEIVIFPGMTLAEIERSAIFQALRHEGGNKKAAADSLGIYRPRLYAKIKHYNLTEFMPEEKPPLEAQPASRRRRTRIGRVA
jgi:DNA-binding NtrC family response regulator